MEKTKEIFNNYIESKRAIKNIVKEIWQYIYDNYKDYLEFGSGSSLYEWEVGDKFMLHTDYLSIQYTGPQGPSYDCEHLKDIPLDIINNDTWKEFVDDIFKEIITERKMEKERELKERKKLYEKLKQEFEEE